MQTTNLTAPAPAGTTGKSEKSPDLTSTLLLIYWAAFEGELSSQLNHLIPLENQRISNVLVKLGEIKPKLIHSREQLCLQATFV